MDFWQRARTFAEEAAKKSQELTQGITTVGATANFSDAVSEASKRSREFAAEASKKSKEFAAEALKRADQIAANIPPPALVLTNLAAAGNNNESAAAAGTAISDADLEVFGVTDELREFVKGITTNTFRDFPLEDDSEVSDIPAVSNVRQDLTEWQEKHAKLVLSTVKEISKLRYQLCPRVMKERKFWRIYFILVNSHVAPYETRYTEAAKLKPPEKVKDAEAKDISPGATSSKTPDGTSKPKTSNAKSAGSDQDLDVFLLGDLEDSDGGPDDGHGDGDDDGFEDDFDKI